MNARVCHRVASWLAGQPLFIEPYALKAMLDANGPRLGLMAPQASQDPDSFAAQKRKAVLERLATIVEAEPVDVADGIGEYGLTADGVAVISIVGALTDRYDWLAAWCGFASYDAIKLTLSAAIADPRVRAILFDVDSGGGAAAGMLDTADAIRAAAALKPIWASANSLAASAAFGLAAAATRLTLPRIASVGSVGVVGIHIDQSGYDKESGLKYTPIYSGARKIDGWGHAPLAKEAKDRFQAQFDEARRKFAEAVGRFRGLDTDAVLATEAAVYDDDEAVRVGFADAVQSFDATLAELTEQVRAGGPSSRVLVAAQSPATAKELTMAHGKKPATGASAEQNDPKDKPESETKDEATKPDDKKEPEKAEGEEGKGAQASKPGAADPAEVVDYCVKNSAATMAAGLIKSGATMDQVKEAVGRAAKIRAMVGDARKISAAIPASFADDQIAAGASVDDVRAALFDKLVSAQSPEIRSTIASDAKTEGARPVIDHRAIYDRMNGIKAT